MSKQKEKIADPLFGTEEQKEAGFSEKSWIIISASSDDNTSVFYYNPGVDKFEEYEDFNHFIESNMDDFCCSGDNPSIHKIIKDNYASISGYSGKMVEDFDEESRKSWMQPEGSAAIMEFYKGGLNEEKLREVLQNIHKDLDNLQSQGAYEAADSHEYNQDPYKYYGVSRKDFL